MLSWRRRSATGAGCVGLRFQPAGFSLAQRIPDEQDRPRLAHCAFHPTPAGAERAELARVVRELGLRGAPTVVALGPSDYHLHAVDAPDVPEAELRGAIRWTLQDLIDSDVEAAIVDALPIPGQEGRRFEHRVYAVAADVERLREILADVRAAGLEPVGFEVAETALRNVAALHPEDERGVLTVALRAGQPGLLCATHGGELYVARWVDADAEALRDEVAKHSDVTGEELDGLLLEIQRSADHYQHELGQLPIARILLAPTGVELPSLCERISQELGFECAWLDPSTLLDGAEELGGEDWARTLPAIGAALRGHGGACHEIDLLQPECEAPTQRLSPVAMARALGAVAAALVLASTGLGVVRLTGGDLVGPLEARAERLAERVAETERELAAHADSAKLEAELAALTRKLDAKQDLVRALTTRPEAEGFSAHLEGLSTGHVAGLWLERFELRDGGASILLAGRSLEPKLVPRFVAGLVAEPAFRDTRFETLRLEAGEADRPGHGFRVSSGRLAELAEAGS